MDDISEETSGLEDFNEDMIDFNDSDEERITHLDEAGLELKVLIAVGNLNNWVSFRLSDLLLMDIVLMSLFSSS
jgi:hypothetical protein